MQEPVPTPTQKSAPRKSVSAIVCAILGLVTLIGVIATALAVWSACPTGEWRNGYTPTPWKGKNMTVAEASAVWKSSKGNEHMELRNAYYPEVTLRLGECKGSGLIFISFYSVTGSQIGEVLRVRYSEKGFDKMDDEWTTSDGMQASVRMSKGFRSAADFELHRVKQDERLWHAEVNYLPEGEDDMQPLGYLSIIPEEK